MPMLSNEVKRRLDALIQTELTKPNLPISDIQLLKAAQEQLSVDTFESVVRWDILALLEVYGCQITDEEFELAVERVLNVDRSGENELYLDTLTDVLCETRNCSERDAHSIVFGE